MKSNFYTCAKCKQTKPKTEFSKCTKSKQGVVSRCKQCTRQDYKDRYDKYRERRRAYHKEYSRKNREKIRNRAREHDRGRREIINQSKRLWRQKHPLDYKRTVVNSNAVRHQAPDRVKLWELEALWEAQGAICPFTLLPLTPHQAVLMYIVHLSNGGDNKITNLIFTNRQVHLYKAALSLEDFCNQAGLDFEVVATRINAIHAKYAELSQK